MVRKAAHELVAGLFRRTLGIHLDKTRNVRHREDEISDLLLDVAVAANRRADLGKLLLDLVERAGNIRPVKADLRGLFLELLRTDKARQALGDTFERRGVGLLLFLLALEVVPVGKNLVGRADLDIPKDMRMAEDQLLQMPSATSSMSNTPFSFSICAWNTT